MRKTSDGQSVTGTEIFQDVKNAVYQIIAGKAATSYAIGLVPMNDAEHAGLRNSAVTIRGANKSLGS